MTETAGSDAAARTRAPTVLIVEDHGPTSKLLDTVLSLEGYGRVHADSAEEALRYLEGRVYDAALVDLRLPGMSGLDLVREIRRRDQSLDIVMMTAHPEVATAIEALKEGAYDYLEKPLNLDRLRHCLKRLVERRHLRAEVSALRSRVGEQVALDDLVGESAVVRRLKELIARVADGDSPILIEGPSGTGKELAAVAIHRLSSRSRGPFVPVNCAALPADLMESEFFGHVKGAFSGAAGETLGLFRSAQGGTLFLDEVAELPAGLQGKLLRVLQEKEVRPVGSTRRFPVDARIVAATNRDIDDALREGRFREDLFYRLNVVRLRMPGLRERREDIPALVAHFIRALNLRYGRGVSGVSPGVLDALAAHDFPGNVRELQNLIERAYALGATGEITLADLPPLGGAPGKTVVAASEGPVPTLAEAERSLIERALRVHGGDREKAAQALGISARTLYRRLRAYGL